MNAVIAPPKPLKATADTVTFSRPEWDAYVQRLEDAEDAAAVDEFDAKVALVGLAEVKRLSYTLAESKRITDGGSPLSIWRERAGLTQRALAERAEMSASYLTEIETGKKPGSAAALLRIAKVLNVPMEMLVAGAESA